MIKKILVAALFLVQPLRALASSATGEIDGFVADHAANMAAASIAVFSQDDVLYEENHGYIDLENGIANSEEAVFEWGSVTKLLVYVSVLQLAEQGLLDLDAYITDYLPAGFTFDFPITIMNLLDHTAGFQEMFIELRVHDDKDVRELGEQLLRTQPPQIFEPGTHHAYSNWGTALAGYIVSLVSGLPFYQYVHEHIFQPWGLTQTALRPDLSDNEWVRARRELTNSYTTTLTNRGTQRWIIPLYPAGQATGTLADFRKFGQGLLEFFQARPHLHTPTSLQPDGVTGRFYHGFFAMPHLQGQVIGHGGNTGMTAMLLIDIERGFGTAVLTNQLSEVTFNVQMLPLIFGMADLSLFDNSRNESQLSGIFMQAQRIERGFLRMANVARIVPIFQDSDGTIQTMGPQAAPGVIDATDMAPFLAFQGRNDTGQGYLTMGPIDFLRLSWGEFILMAFLLIALLVAALFAVVRLIVLAVKALRKKAVAGSCSATVICLGMLLLFANLLATINSTMSMQANLTSAMVNGLLFIGLTLMIASGIGYHFKTLRRLTFTSSFGILVLANVIYWELWRFWV